MTVQGHHAPGSCFFSWLRLLLAATLWQWREQSRA